MKLCILLLTILSVACGSADKPPASDAAAENKRAKNREIAAKNEVTEITKTFQKLEQQGRGMEIFRQANNAANDRECAAAMEDAQKQTTALEAKIKNLPESFHAKLMPMIGEVAACAACADDAMESCKKARASINQAIKELYP